MNDKLCAAPFVSFYTGEHGKVSSCCAMRDSIGNSNENNFEHIMNSDSIKEIRKSFLNNRFPKQCNSCEKFEIETGNIADVRKFSNNLVDGKFDFLKHTLPDGTLTKQSPVFLDLLFSNKCNFACMGCNPQLSSTIADNYSEAYEIVDLKTYNKKNWHNKTNIIDYVLAHKDTIKLLHLNGGEPFMQEDVHELLDVLLDNGLHETIKIWTHTNGSIKKYKGVDVVEDYLQYWGQNCQISLSHDLHNQRGEYVRYGLATKKWEENFYRFDDADIHVNIQTSYSIFNCTHLCDLYHYYTRHLMHTGALSLSPWLDPKPFTAQFAQMDEDILAEANTQLDMIEFMIGDEGTRLHAWNTAHLRNFLNVKWTGDQRSQLKSQFKKGIAKFDELRGTNFVETFPELKNLYLN